MKEMVGGCCVCSDERGWPENPLVYCDGQNCSVAVHQACYGIVTVPTGPWYCRKCESQERAARVRCELCPSRNGALKKTDTQGWAHVVCALYIPEVRFGDVTTMEPIVLALIPQERYSKPCYICQELGKGSKATMGACMQCNKSGCKQLFHVTCAQALGLLCEEAGNYLDNVKYCGYCQHHYSKLKKGGNVKPIPPYKPISHDTSDSPSSPEKETESGVNVIQATPSSSSINLKPSTLPVIPTVPIAPPSSSSSSSSSSSKQRKSSSTSKQSASHSSALGSSNLGNSLNSSSTNHPSTLSGSGSIHNINNSAQGPTVNSTNSNSGSSSSNSKGNSSSSKDKEKHSKNGNKVSSSNKNHDKEKSSKSSKGSNSSNSNNSSTGRDSSSIIVENHSSNKINQSSNDGFSNKLLQSSLCDGNVDSLYNTENPKSSGGVSKKRKNENSKTIAITNENLNSRDLLKDVSVTLIPLPMEKIDQVDEKNKKVKTENDHKIENDIQMQPVNELNSQNLNPNVPAHLIVSKHNYNLPSSSSSMVIPSSSSSMTTSNPIIKAPILKDIGDNRNHSMNVQTTSSQPSLVVSVPLSTATVPGVNLPPNSVGSSIITAGNMSQQNSFAQAIRGNENRSSQMGGPQNHLTVLHGHPSSSGQLDRRTLNIVSGNMHNSNESQGGIQNSSTLNHLSSSASVTTMESGALKVTYDKHSNSRLHQVQEDSNHRRSRSNDKNKYVGNEIRSMTSAQQLASSAIAAASCNTFNEHHGINGPLIHITPFQTNTANHSTLTHLNDCPSTSNSRTPEFNTNTSSFTGLKFSYEPQINVQNSSGGNPLPNTTTSQTIGGLSITPTNLSITPQPTIKDSPPSSPGSEAGSARPKRNSGASDTKDFKIFQNGVHASHMLGNQLNPNSMVAQKMSDQLHMEMEAHSVYTSSSLDSGPQLVGPTFPGKAQAQARNMMQQPVTNSLSSMLGGNGTPTAAGSTPQSLEQLLERQWEQGSQFLMEQAQHFDIASLLSCLHQLRTENIRLEEHVNNLVSRRDHLLAVNARLAIPLNPPVPQHGSGNFNSSHVINGPSDSGSTSNRNIHRSGANHQQSQQQQQSHFPQIVENGIDFRHNASHLSSNNPSTIRQPHANPNNSNMANYGGSVQPHTQNNTNRQQSQQQNSGNVSIINQTGEPNPRNPRNACGGGGFGAEMIGSNSSSFLRNQQTIAYATSQAQHQSQIRRDDSKVKPS